MHIIIFSCKVVFFLALATKSKRTCQKKSSKGQAFRQNLWNLLDGNSNETNGDDVVNGNEEYVQKSPLKRKTEKQEKKGLHTHYFTFSSLLHHKLCPNNNMFKPNSCMTSNWTAKFSLIFTIPNCSLWFSCCTSISLNKLFFVVNGPAVRLSPQKKGRPAESKEEEENILDYLSDETDSEALVINNEKLDQEKEIWNEQGTILYYIMFCTGLQ